MTERRFWRSALRNSIVVVVVCVLLSFERVFCAFCGVSWVRILKEDVLILAALRFRFALLLFCLGL